MPGVATLGLIRTKGASLKRGLPPELKLTKLTSLHVFPCLFPVSLSFP